MLGKLFAMARQKKPAREHPKLSVHQVVAYNFRRARESLGWTQAETSERLAPYVGLRLNQAGVSAIEKTYDSERRRNIDVAEIVAFARCFGVPLGWFFVPPPGRGADWIEPANDGEPRANLAASDLRDPRPRHPREGGRPWPPASSSSPAATPDDTRLARSASRSPACATTEWQGQQIDLRRQALLATTLVEYATPGEQTIKKMAELLVELVKLTPIGFDQLRATDPDEALRLLAQGDQLVQPRTPRRDSQRRSWSAESERRVRRPETDRCPSGARRGRRRRLTDAGQRGAQS